MTCRHGVSDLDELLKTMSATPITINTVRLPDDKHTHSHTTDTDTSTQKHGNRDSSATYSHSHSHSHSRPHPHHTLVGSGSPALSTRRSVDDEVERAIAEAEAASRAKLASHMNKANAASNTNTRPTIPSL